MDDSLMWKIVITINCLIYTDTVYCNSASCDVYRPQTKLPEGNGFSLYVCLCLSVHRKGHSCDYCKSVQICSLGDLNPLPYPRSCLNLFCQGSGRLAFDWKGFLLSLSLHYTRNVSFHPIEYFQFMPWNI